MNNKISSNYDQAIKEHYDKVAVDNKDKPSCTMDNDFVRDTETDFIVDTIKKYIKSEKKDYSLVDVGCGNGYTLDMLSKNFTDIKFRGIEQNDSLRNLADEKVGKYNINIYSGDIRNEIKILTEKIDILVCQRVIINLLDKDDQTLALKNIINCVKDDGLLIFIECFSSGLKALNLAREEFKLSDLPPAHHNLYLDDNFFDTPELIDFDSTKKEFLSTHYYVSRVMHPNILDLTNQEFRRNSEYVKFFSKALSPSIGDFSPIKFLSFIKKKI